ncbi:MAG: hypothetical protein WAO02_13560 [Verrucomicrobiia bacterium]
MKETKETQGFLMPRVYEICGDEAWTHTNKPLNRYWCFFGGLLASQSDSDELEGVLRKCIERHGHGQEVKWKNLDTVNLGIYKELVDILADYLQNREVRYRQVFLDRTYVHVPDLHNPPLSDLDIQFRICYQFLKHSFGLSYLPAAEGGFDKILIRLDTHSSQKHKRELRDFVENLPSLIGRTDLAIELVHVCSHHMLRLGVCDIMLGAAGSYGNRIHDRREFKQRGMTFRQKFRLEMAKYVSHRLRDLNNSTRGKAAFSWFESTSQDGNPQNNYFHKLRIWKFHPLNYKIDRGWQNSHLDNQGRYQGPDIVEPTAFEDPFKV